MSKSKKTRFSREYFENKYKQNVFASNKRNLSKIKKQRFNKPLPDDLKNRIERFVGKFNFNDEFTYDNVVSLIQSSIIFSAKFIVDAGRQNIFETTAFGFLKKIIGKELSDHVEKLPNAGVRSCYVVNGALIHNLPRNQRQGQKSIDFRITLDNLTFYIAHKYTSEDGGAQDNQFNDLLGFITHANKNKDKSLIFVAIADGPYYRGARMLSLQETANKNNNVYATDMFGFSKIIHSYISKSSKVKSLR